MAGLCLARCVGLLVRAVVCTTCFVLGSPCSGPRARSQLPWVVVVWAIYWTACWVSGSLCCGWGEPGVLCPFGVFLAGARSVCFGLLCGPDVFGRLLWAVVGRLPDGLSDVECVLLWLACARRVWGWVCCLGAGAMLGLVCSFAITFAG